MNSPSSLRLLGTTTNEKGDLFTRLSRDLFFSLGYDNLELDVATSGRELDIQGDHRFEPRRLVAECKAHASTIGGGDVNKFLGVLTRERKKHYPRDVTGYFVSLGGFTGTCIQQEAESGDSAIILFNGEKVIEELQRGRVIVRLEEATERAGRCAESNGLADFQLEKVEIIGHAIGYLWVVYFSRNKELSHFIFIHADGTPISKAVAEAVIETDQLNGGDLHALTYLIPPIAKDTHQLKEDTFAEYKNWLGAECGYIQLDGLPADSDLSATKLKLEKLFVPLKAIYKKKFIQLTQHDFDFDQIDLAEVEISESDEVETELESSFEENNDIDTSDMEFDSELITESIGSLLEKEHHLAILASPGGGKSTLVKRLATAYSFPGRRLEVADGLPDIDWLPLYLRCRDLRDRSHRPVLELLHGIAAFANMSEEHAKCFRSGVSDALRSGRALLLVDGIDEISEESARRAFAQNLRTFIAMFPNAALVVTSRVAGFRDIAGVIAGTCQQIEIAPLDRDDVSRLCVSWHSEVVADTEKVRKEAAELADQIWRNQHIRSLVENPLLLTTLLVVKRSNGEIPPSRAELYSEAVRVLVRTWNVEGYAPLDERETLARLSYVACAMTQRGIQLIGNTALIKLLHEAAKEMEPELQFAKVSPAEFIQRIEYRSSLLMQTGYQKIDEELQPVFEFRHLTFQEYLAAKGFVGEQYPGRNEEASLVELFSPHIEDERWQEVIPLATVLAGRKAEPIIKKMIEESGRIEMEWNAFRRNDARRVVNLLGKCLVEDVTLTPGTLRDALTEIALKLSHRIPNSLFESLLIGKFGSTLRNLIEEGFYSNGENWTYFSSALSEVYRIDLAIAQTNLLGEKFCEELSDFLLFGDRMEKVRAALLLMLVAYQSRDDESKVASLLRPHSKKVWSGFLDMLRSGDLPSAQAASWALAWFGTARVWPQPIDQEIIKNLFRLWHDEKASELVRMAAWAFNSHPLHARDSIPLDFWGDCDAWLESQWTEANGNSRGDAALTLGWYRRAPWTDDELVNMISKPQGRRNIRDGNTRELLASLGDAGLRAISKFERRKR